MRFIHTHFPRIFLVPEIVIDGYENNGEDQVRPKVFNLRFRNSRVLCNNPTGYIRQVKYW